MRLVIRATNPAGAPVTSLEMALDNWDVSNLDYVDTVVTTPFDTFQPFGQFILFQNVRPGETRTAYIRMRIKASPATMAVRFGGTYEEGSSTGGASGTMNEVTLEIER